jgi:hypothetical protein
MTIRVMTKPTLLTWNDFRPVDVLPDGSGEEAQISSEMPAMQNIKPVENNGKYSLPDLELTVGLTRSETVVVKNARRTANLLKHEQGHFDITVLTIRVLAMELQRLNAASVASLAKQIEMLRQKHQRCADAIEEKYDVETNHSRNREVQNKWDRAIQGAMGAQNVTSLLGMLL